MTNKFLRSGDDLPAPHDAAEFANRLILEAEDINDEEGGRYDILVYVRDRRWTPGMTVSQDSRKSSTRMNFDGADSFREVKIELNTTLNAAIRGS